MWIALIIIAVFVVQPMISELQKVFIESLRYKEMAIKYNNSQDSKIAKLRCEVDELRSQVVTINSIVVDYEIGLPSRNVPSVEMPTEYRHEVTISR